MIHNQEEPGQKIVLNPRKTAAELIAAAGIKPDVVDYTTHEKAVAFVGVIGAHRLGLTTLDDIKNARSSLYNAMAGAEGNLAAPMKTEEEREAIKLQITALEKATNEQLIAVHPGRIKAVSETKNPPKRQV